MTKQNQRLAPTTYTTASDNPLCSTTAVLWGVCLPLRVPRLVELLFSVAFCCYLWFSRPLTGAVLFLAVFCGLDEKFCGLGDRKRLPRPLTGTGPMSDKRNSEQFDEWIITARARLAARRNGRPTTKSGAIRALWPEIQQALHSGQTLKTVRDWLEAEGVSVRYNQLATYVARLRQKQAQASTVQSEIRTEDNRPAPEPGPVVRDPLANLRSREGRPRTFEYNPEFKEEELL